MISDFERIAANMEATSANRFATTVTWPVGEFCGADNEASHATKKTVAEEQAVGLVYNTIPFAVMMATASDLEDLAIGFSVTEGIVPNIAAVRSVEIVASADTQDGVEARVWIRGNEFSSLMRARRRTMVGRVACGLCGVESLDEAVRPSVAVREGRAVSLGALRRAVAGLAARQTLNSRVHMVHAAAWATPAGDIVIVREDVGRHNALDKLIGAALRQGVDFGAGFCVITSRCSYEMIQKSTAVGMSILVAISAPTGLALRKAQEAGLTLVAQARSDTQTVYTHPWRIESDMSALSPAPMPVEV
jgi:FdhD protein